MEEEISGLSHSIVFLYFFALIPEEGFLISPCYSLELCIQMDISFLFSFAFYFSSFHSYLSALSDSHFAFLHFFFLGMVLIPVSCTMSQTSVHSSSGTLSIRSAAAAAAKLLQSCPTLCNPIDGSPPDSPIPGILQARTGVGCHFLLRGMTVKSEK